ncbi:MAG: glycosyltransferase family 2 protein [Rhodobacteraceae bacterium]|nr:glycosyltransferase family 2 protein [Paracoccaceae bacterium]
MTDRRLIVTLSSIPPRFAKLDETLQALLRQTARIDAVQVYIPEHYRRFPDWDGTLPDVPAGVEIHRTRDDLGPATKVLAAAREFRNQDIDILFCDDDRAYPAGWAAHFVNDRKRHPEAAIANLGVQAHMITTSTAPRKYQPRSERSWRITDAEFQLKFLWRQIRAGRHWSQIGEPRRRVNKNSGYVDIFEGCAGVMVRPDWFDEVAFDIPPAIWMVDDVWLSGMLARADVPIWLHGNIHEPDCTAAEPFAPLVTSVVQGTDRETANRLAVEYLQQTFGVWQ